MEALADFFAFLQCSLRMEAQECLGLEVGLEVEVGTWVSLQCQCQCQSQCQGQGQSQGQSQGPSVETERGWIGWHRRR